MKKLTKYQKLVAFSVLTLVVLIVTFIVLNTFVHPRVLKVVVNGGENSATIKNQQIRIDFNRPMIKDDIKKYLSTNPEIEFRDVWSANTLVLIPTETLDSQTQYTLSIKKEIQDIYNETFIEDFTYTFKTEIPRFAVLEKSFGTSSNIIATYNADFSNRVELIKRDNIKFYGINDNFLVVVTEDNYSNNIEVLNLRTNEIKNFNLGNTRIATFDMSNSSSRNEFAYTKQSIEVRDTYYVPTSLSKVYVYSIDSQSESVFNPEDTAAEVISLKYSNDGSSLLYKNSESFYNLAEPTSESDYTSLGRFLSEGNFDKDNSSIVFVNYDPLNTYTLPQFLTVFNADRVVKNIDNDNIPVLDPQFKNRTNEIVYAEKYKDLEATKGIYKIMQIDLEGNKSEIISSKYSLELPKLSADDRYIAVEQYTELHLKDFSSSRNFGFQNKPSYASIVIFDTLENKIYDSTLIGIDVKWL